MTIEPLRQHAPPLPGRVVFGQRWTDLAMLHWPVDPALVAPLLPPGTFPDLHDDATYVGLVPFTMADVEVLGVPPLPWLSRFAETNVRLYVVDADGRRGVVFRSLEAARLLPVLSAQLAYHLPYRWARMRVVAEGPRRTWTTSRRWPGPRGAGGSIAIEIGQRYEPDPLSLFLTARWGLYSRFYRGRTAWAPVHHEPWPLHRARLLHLSDDLVPTAGLPIPVGEPHVLWSPGVTVRIGRPTVLR